MSNLCVSLCLFFDLSISTSCYLLSTIFFMTFNLKQNWKIWWCWTSKFKLFTFFVTTLQPTWFQRISSAKTTSRVFQFRFHTSKIQNTISNSVTASLDFKLLHNYFIILTVSRSFTQNWKFRYCSSSDISVSLFLKNLSIAYFVKPFPILNVYKK